MEEEELGGGVLTARGSEESLEQDNDDCIHGGAESENLMAGFLRGGFVCRRSNSPLKARCSPRFVQPSGKSRVHPFPKRRDPHTSRLESRYMIGGHP
ncbi:hypothetical protein BHM03_00062495 [Ensete ventricosum]|nr:hypothetical protein BHM03_00062495 [Ensete ventricosum]